MGGLTQPQRAQAIEVLLQRRDLLDQADLPEPALNLLRQGVTDGSPAVRERTLTGISSLPRLWSSPAAASLLLSALADDSPALAARALRLSAAQNGLLEPGRCARAPEAAAGRPGCPVRELAISVVEGNQLLAKAAKQGATGRLWRGG